MYDDIECRDDCDDDSEEFKGFDRDEESESFEKLERDNEGDNEVRVLVT